jgi:hypothetical protein
MLKPPIKASKKATSDSLIDSYTVEHQYYKNGSMILVHYTHTQILARINQYKMGNRMGLSKKELDK